MNAGLIKFAKEFTIDAEVETGGNWNTCGIFGVESGDTPRPLKSGEFGPSEADVHARAYNCICWLSTNGDICCMTFIGDMTIGSVGFRYWVAARLRFSGRERRGAG